MGATEIKLGQKVRCKLTGFTGAVDYITTNLFDALKIGIQAPAVDGKLGECYSIDYHTVEILEPEPLVEAIPSTPKFKLGQKVKCTITHFEGTVTAIVQHLNGCVRYKVQPRIPQGGKPADYDAHYFPEGALVGKEMKKEMLPQKHGGPREKKPSFNF